MLAGLLAGGLTAGAALRPAPMAEPRLAAATTPASPPLLAASATAARGLGGAVATAGPAGAEAGAVAAAEAAAEAAAAEELAYETAARLAQTGGPARSDIRPVLVWPAHGPLTGWWGERRGVRSHPGLDVDGETGDAVVGAGRGVVVHAGPAPSGYGGYGTMVLINHGAGVETLYSHLSRVDVAAGQQVATGALVGAIGTTGRVTGSHLHFEVRLGGVPVDPRPWLPPR